MSDILSLLARTLGGNTTQDLARTIGADEAGTQNALAAALPLLVAGLAKNAAQPEGASALLGALTKDHDGNVLDNLGALLGGAPGAPSLDGSAIVGHVLGGRQEVAQQAVAKAGGIDPAAAARLLAVAAPLVMAALGRMRNERNLDANGLASLLGGEQEAIAAQQPGLMGMAAKLLDANHDGNVMDELTGIAGKLFGGR